MPELSRAQVAQRLRRVLDQLRKSESQITAYHSTVPPQPGGFSRSESEKRDELFHYHSQRVAQLREQAATLNALYESSPQIDEPLRLSLRDSKKALAGIHRLATGEETHPTWDASFLHYAQQLTAAVKVLRANAARLNHGHVASNQSSAPTTGATQPQQ